MQWLNEAPSWSHEGDTITMTSAAHTDFWRITHDNGQRDSGHFYHDTVNGDFVATVRFSGRYAALYDQAGLMVRLDAEHWMKCGVEFFNGVQHASAVVTRQYSDWSVLPLDGAPAALWLRVTRHIHTLEVAYSLDGETYAMLRQAYFPPDLAVQVGVMACAPTGEGFPVTFDGFRVEPLTAGHA